MNKNSLGSLGLFLGTSLALPIAISACTKPLPPAKSYDSKSSPTTSASASASAPTPAYTKPKIAKPLTNEDFFANMISCEATVNAHIGYINSLKVRTGSEVIDLDTAPCNIVLDIHGNATRIIDSCSQVIEPEGLFMELDPRLKTARSSIIAQAREAISTAIDLRKQIEKHEKRCFNDKKVLISL